MQGHNRALYPHAYRQGFYGAFDKNKIQHDKLLEEAASEIATLHKALNTSNTTINFSDSLTFDRPRRQTTYNITLENERQDHGRKSCDDTTCHHTIDVHGITTDKLCNGYRCCFCSQSVGEDQGVSRGLGFEDPQQEVELEVALNLVQLLGDGLDRDLIGRQLDEFGQVHVQHGDLPRNAVERGAEQLALAGAGRRQFLENSLLPYPFP